MSSDSLQFSDNIIFLKAIKYGIQIIPFSSGNEYSFGYLIIYLS